MKRLLEECLSSKQASVIPPQEPPPPPQPPLPPLPPKKAAPKEPVIDESIKSYIAGTYTMGMNLLIHFLKITNQKYFKTTVFFL